MKRLLFAVAVALLNAASAAHAARIDIIENGGSISVTSSGIAGFSCSSILAESVSGCTGSFSTSSANTAGILAGDAYLYVPGNPLLLDDLVELQWSVSDGVATIHNMRFWSDSALPTTVNPFPASSQADDGSLFDLTYYFLDSSGVGQNLPQGFQIFVQSETPAVPEPGSIALLALGLAALARVARRSAASRSIS